MFYKYQTFHSFAVHDYDLITAIRKISTGEWNGVAFTNDLTVNYFNYISRSSMRIKCTRDLVRLQNPVFLFGKNSLLTSMFNDKIELCQESGLINHWVGKFKHNHKKHKNHKNPKKLGVENILGILKISGVMYSISCAVLFMEIVSGANRIIKKFLDFLTH